MVVVVVVVVVVLGSSIVTISSSCGSSSRGGGGGSSSCCCCGSRADWALLDPLSDRGKAVPMARNHVSAPALVAKDPTRVGPSSQAVQSSSNFHDIPSELWCNDEGQKGGLKHRLHNRTRPKGQDRGGFGNNIPACRNLEAIVR